MEYINEFHKQWIERTASQIALWSKQPASLEEKKEAKRTFGPTESYVREGNEELISFANSDDLMIPL